MQVNKLTKKEFETFVFEYMNHKIYKMQRFGQAFMNHYELRFPDDNEVYHEDSIKIAMQLVEQRYVQTSG
jgi:hypothetical protein